MNILVVDDNPISGRVMESTLQNHGYATLMARDGLQALDQLDSHPEIGLVITDIVMPNVDGKELVRIIKKRREWQDIPVLIATSLKPEDVFRESLPMGGQYYLFKPVKSVSLLQKVKECLNGRQVALCDLDETRAEMGLVPEVFDEIIADFLKIVEDRIGQLEQNHKFYDVRIYMKSPRERDYFRLLASPLCSLGSNEPRIVNSSRLWSIRFTHCC